MKGYYVRIVDENGFFIEDAFVDELTSKTITTPCPPGFILPRWDGEQWVEAGTAPEPVTPEPTETECIAAQLAQTNADFQAFMDYYFTKNPE